MSTFRLPQVENIEGPIIVCRICCMCDIHMLHVQVCMYVHFFRYQVKCCPHKTRDAANAPLPPPFIFNATLYDFALFQRAILYLGQWCKRLKYIKC
jgi:hypothetical protein